MKDRIMLTIHGDPAVKKGDKVKISGSLADDLLTVSHVTKGDTGCYTIHFKRTFPQFLRGIVTWVSAWMKKQLSRFRR